MASAAARPSAIACATRRGTTASPIACTRGPSGVSSGRTPSPLTDEHDEVRGDELGLARQAVPRGEAVPVDRLWHEEREQPKLRTSEARPELDPALRGDAGREGARRRDNADLPHARCDRKLDRAHSRPPAEAVVDHEQALDVRDVPPSPRRKSSVVVTARSLPGMSGKHLVAPRREDDLVRGRQVVAPSTRAEPELHRAPLETRRVEVEDPPPPAAERRAARRSRGRRRARRRPRTTSLPRVPHARA